MTLETFKDVVIEKKQDGRKQRCDSLKGIKSMKEVSYWTGYVQALEEVDYLLMSVTANREGE